MPFRKDTEHTITQVIEAAENPDHLLVHNRCAKHNRERVTEVPREPAIPSKYWPALGNTQTWQVTDELCAEEMPW